MVTIQLDSQYIGEVTLRVHGPTGMHRYRGDDGEIVFVPREAGTHYISARRTGTRETLLVREFTVLPPTLPILEKGSYRLGERVTMNLPLEEGHEYRLSVANEDRELSWVGQPKERTTFKPEWLGTYTIELSDITTGTVQLYTFVVEPGAKMLTLKDRKNRLQLARYRLLKEGIEVFRSEEGVGAPEGRFDVEMENPLPNLKQIQMRDYNTSNNGTLGLEPSRASIDQAGATTVDGFALDPTALDFTDGTITKEAQGQELWKCAEWNFTTSTCEGEWVKLRDLVAGEEYNISFNSSDPAFVEVNLTVLNVQSYPLVGGNWRVDFETEGTANLSIRGINGTSWHDLLETEDLRLLTLTCDGASVPYTWENGTLFVEEWSCNGTGSETSLVLTPGKHHLEFRFGDAVAWANNYASATGILILVDSAGGDNGNTNSPGVNMTWDTQRRIDAIYTHTVDTDVITVNSDGIYAVSYSAFFNRSNTANARNEITARLMVNGAEANACGSNTYIRANSGHFESGLNSYCLLNLTTGDELAINFVRTGGNYEVSVTPDRADFNMRLLTHSDVLILADAGGGQDTNPTTGTNLTWDTLETNGSSFNYTVDDEAVTINEDGLYRINYGINTFQSSNRYAVRSEILVNGVVQKQGYQVAFLRGGGQDCDNAFAVGDALLQLKAGDEVVLRASRASSDSRTVSTVGGNVWFHFERMDDATDYYVATKSGAGENIGDSASGLLIDFDAVNTSGSFFNQVDDETVQVLTTGLYYLSYGINSYRTSGGTRWGGWSRLEINDVANESCWSSAYNRGFPSSAGQIGEDGFSAGCLLELNAGDNLSIRAGRTSSGQTLYDNADQTWLYIIALDSLGENPSVSSLTADPSIVEFGSSVNLSATVTDNTAVDTVIIEVDNGTVKTNYSTSNISSSYWNASYTATTLGVHTFRIYANDTNGFSNTTESSTFTVSDTTNPSVTSLTDTPDPLERGSPLNISVAISDLHSINSVLIEIDYPTLPSANFTTINDGSTWWNQSINGTELGSHSYRIYANDSSGNRNWTETGTYTVQDTTPPSVTDTIEDPDPVDSGTPVNISALILDFSGVDSVTIQVTPPTAPAENLTGIQSGNRWWNNSFMPAENGFHTVTYFTNDSQGNRNDTVTSTFEVKNDPDPPTLSALTVVPDPVTTYNTVNISLTAVDGANKVDVVVIEVTPPNGTPTNYSTQNLSSNYWNQSIPTAENGIHFVKIYANDTRRNMNDSANITFLATESVTPVVQNFTASPDPVNYSGMVNLSIDVIDNVDVHVVIFEVTPPIGPPVNYTGTKQGNNYWNASMPTTVLGVHNVKIYANDTAGNLNSSETGIFTVQDATIPTVSGVATNQSFFILSQSITAGTVNLSATITDNAFLDTVLIEVTGPSGSVNYTTENQSSTFYNGSIPVTENGTYTFRFIANDTANNVNGTESGTFSAYKYGYFTITLLDPIIDDNVTQNQFFNVSVNVTCFDGYCGDLNVSLDPQSNWWNESFAHRREITIDNTAANEDHSDFNLFLTLNASTVDYSHTNDDGSDIRFVASDNTTVLDHEIEWWNEAGTSYLWVQIPTLDSSSEQTIWLYYGNETVAGVNETYTWKSNYVAVYHMTPDGEDSTSNDQDRVSIQGNPVQSVGSLGNETIFDGSNDAWSFSDLSLWETAFTERTFHIVFTTGTDIVSPAGVFTEGGGSQGFMISINDSKLWANWVDSNANICILNTTISANTRYHVAAEIDYPGNCTLYVNGTLNQTMTAPRGVGGHTGDGAIGGTVANKLWPTGGNTQYNDFDGTIHEAYIFSSPESGEWHASMQRNFENTLVTGVSAEVTKDKGLISTMVGALPFYTTDENPYNKTHVACLGAMGWGDWCQLNWSVNATGADGSWFEFFAFANSNETLVANNESGRVNLTIIQDSGPPVIENISLPASVTPLLNQNVTIEINFTVSDPQGVDDLNDSTATLHLNQSGIQRNGTCTPNDQDSTTTIYNCTIELRHYDLPGTWSVNVSVNDTALLSASNLTILTYNPLVAISLRSASYDFGTLNPGTSATAGTSNPFLIDNQGNVEISGINITAATLASGSSKIGPSNVTANIVDSSGTPLLNGSMVVIPGATVSVDTDLGENDRALYFYIATPAALSSGSYSSTSNWVVTTHD
jgi:hypothetical protein